MGPISSRIGGPHSSPFPEDIYDPRPMYVFMTELSKLRNSLLDKRPFAEHIGAIQEVVWSHGCPLKANRCKLVVLRLLRSPFVGFAQRESLFRGQGLRFEEHGATLAEDNRLGGLDSARQSSDRPASDLANRLLRRRSPSLVAPRFCKLRAAWPANAAPGQTGACDLWKSSLRARDGRRMNPRAVHDRHLPG